MERITIQSAIFCGRAKQRQPGRVYICRRPRGVGIIAWSTRMGRLGAMNYLQGSSYCCASARPGRGHPFPARRLPGTHYRLAESPNLGGARLSESPNRVRAIRRDSTSPDHMGKRCLRVVVTWAKDASESAPRGEGQLELARRGGPDAVGALRCVIVVFSKRGAVGPLAYESTCRDICPSG